MPIDTTTSGSQTETRSMSNTQTINLGQLAHPTRHYISEALDANANKPPGNYYLQGGRFSVSSSQLTSQYNDVPCLTTSQTDLAEIKDPEMRSTTALIPLPLNAPPVPGSDQTSPLVIELGEVQVMNDEHLIRAEADKIPDSHRLFYLDEAWQPDETVEGVWCRRAIHYQSKEAQKSVLLKVTVVVDCSEPDDAAEADA